MRALALGTLLPSFDGLTVPDWLAAALSDGLAGVCLFAVNTPDVATTRRLTDELRRHAGRELIVASDEEGGDVTRIQAGEGSSLPGAAALGAVDDEHLTRRCGVALGAVLATAGINLDLAPVLDVASEPDNPVIGVRAFAPTPDRVIAHGRAFVDGLAAAGVAACAKHFPGHGATTIDSHLALPTLDADPETLHTRDLRPFAEVRTAAVMTAHVVVPALDERPATLAPWAAAALRKGGHDGVIVTDALGMRAIADHIPLGEACVRALEAGADLLCLDAPHQRDARTCFDEALAAVEGALRSGRLDAQRVAASVARNRALAAAHPPLPAEDPTPLLARLDAVGLEAARRAVRATGNVRLSGPPVLLDVRRRAQYAAGRTSTAFASVVQEAFPGARALAPADPAEAAAAATGPQDVVVLTSMARAEEREGALLARVLEARPDAVVVHAGVAEAAPRAARLVLSLGVGRANARAVVALLGADR